MQSIKSLLFLIFVGFIIFALTWYFIDEIMNESWGKIIGLIGAFVIGYIIAQVSTENRQRKLF